MAFKEYEKDFGYLMPFIKRVSESARTASDPATREQLTQLVKDEEQRWTRIRELLSSSDSTTTNAPAATPSAERQAQAPAEQPSLTDRPYQFTVGSLRPRQSS